MQNILPFDPTQSTTNSFVAHLPNGGWLLVINESVIGLQLFMPNTGFKSTVPPYCMRMMRLTVPLERVEWSQAYTITGGQSPLNTVVGEVYEQSEWTGGEFLIPLPRLVNIGNQVSTTSSQTLINDGAAAGSPFIEATAASSPGSNVKILNDGTVVISVLSSGAYVPVLQITPGGASTPMSLLFANGLATKGALSLDNGAIKTDGAGNVNPVGAVTGGPFHGTADAANSVPASGVQAGNLGTGVVLGSAVSGLLSAGTPNLCRLFTPQIASQAYRFGVVTWDGTTGHSAILVDENGVRTADTVPATGVTAGTLASGVNVPAANVLTGNLANGVYLAGALTGLLTAGTPNLCRLFTPQVASQSYRFSVVTWDGAAGHSALLVDETGKRFSDTVPASGVTAGTLVAGVNEPAANVVAGQFQTGKFIMQSPANGSGTPDTLALNDGGGANPLLVGVSKTGDTVNVPGGYVFDTVSGDYVIKGGLLVPASMASGNLPSGVKQQNGATVMGFDSAGGGAAGTRTWVGTTDPGVSAAEGDTWMGA